jgi:hypothetical protein
MRRSLVAAALTASLLAPGAGQPHPLWAFLSSLWSGITEKEGGGADPNGSHALAPRPTTDAGGGADPDGRYTTPPPQPKTDAGGGWDPNG